MSAGKTVEPVSDPVEAMRLLQKNDRILKAGVEGLNLVNLAGEMLLVTFKKGDMIVEYGELNQNFYILKKGTLKITEYTPDSSPYEQDLEQKISKVRYVSEEGHTFFGEVAEISTELPRASIEAMDERCELYMLEASKREQLKDNDMAKTIHQVLYMS